VRDVGDAAVLVDPVDDLLQRGELALRDDRVGLHSQGQDVGVVLGPSGLGVQLGGGDDEELPGRALVGPDPVIGDREHVEARPLVVAYQHVGRQLSVGIRGVRMERAAEPDAVALRTGS